MLIPAGERGSVIAAVLCNAHNGGLPGISIRGRHKASITRLKEALLLPSFTYAASAQPGEQRNARAPTISHTLWTGWHERLGGVGP
jgi:hypothetical protein